METSGDPTPELMRMMDKAGLTGQLQATKGPMIVGITNVRVELARILAAYISEERSRAYQAGVVAGSNNTITD